MTNHDSTIEQSWSDILDWFRDAGLERIADNLNGPADTAAIEAVEALVETPMPAGLRWLYARHDGQASLDRYPIFSWMAFIPLRHFEWVREGMLLSYFGVARGGTLVDDDAIFDAPERPLRDAERDSAWWPFANTGGDFLAVHGRSGRVARDGLRARMSHLTLARCVRPGRD